MKCTMIFPVILFIASAMAEDFPKPFSPPCVERANTFEFGEKPSARFLGNDKYEITFSVKGFCDVTVAVIDKKGKVVRHLGAGVLGSNAPDPFQKNSLKQKIYWNGKDDLGNYPKNGTKLKIRVMLGLKPTFDKRLGGTSPKNLPGKVWGLALDERGAYLVIGDGGGFSHKSVRMFDRDGKYIKVLYPPPAGTPLNQLEGSGFVEYEAGQRAWHGPDLYWAIAGNGLVFSKEADYKAAHECQLGLAGKKLMFLNAGSSLNSRVSGSMIFSINTDGTTSAAGLLGRPFAWGAHFSPVLAGSPDGKWVYMVCSLGGKYTFDPVAVRAPADGSKPATVFFGDKNKAGSDATHLNGPTGLACDAGGRVYIADSRNSRIQIVSPEGKLLKTIPIERPRLVKVHQKTGAIYVQHLGRVKGKSVARITKFESFEKPVVSFYMDLTGSRQMGLDSWSTKPRLWLAGGLQADRNGRQIASYSLRIFEEDGKKFRLLRDFGGEARKEDKDDFTGRWSGSLFDKVVCDPTREQVYYHNSRVFDLKSGKYIGRFSPGRTCRFDDMAFDKFGYLHAHFNPCFFGQGVGRMDPSQAKLDPKTKSMPYPEIPYDYGIQKYGWTGILPTKDQTGAKGFQDGLGVNMRGDIAEQCNIYHLPRMEEEGWSFAAQSISERRKRGEYVDGSSGRNFNSFAKYAAMIREKEKRGETVYSIKRRPGIPLVGGTVWTFDRHGELLKECAVIAGDLINGVQMDEDQALYFVNARPKYYNGKSFLFGKGGLNGVPNAKRSHPFTGSLIKSKPKTTCTVLLRNAKIPMDPLPNRPPDLMNLNFMTNIGEGAGCWVDGAEWIYAGASPITSTGCSCPRQHLGLDWYKRTFVPEAYRHSIGVLDSNGNLILHIGRYGNFDSGMGSKSKVPVGGDGIGMMITRFISATDNYLAYGDWGERLMVLKLAYHAEETVSIKE